MEQESHGAVLNPLAPKNRMQATSPHLWETKRMMQEAEFDDVPPLILYWKRCGAVHKASAVK